MIAPDFRNTENPNFLEAYHVFIAANHGIVFLTKSTKLYSIGDTLWKDLEMDF